MVWFPVACLCESDPMTSGAGGEEICLDDGRKKAEREAGATGWFITSKGTAIVICLCQQAVFYSDLKLGESCTPSRCGNYTRENVCLGEYIS